MIKKPRKIPLLLLQLQALQMRLPFHHPKKELVETDKAKILAGYKGERSLDYYLNLLPQKDYYILHALRIPFQTSFFQIDTLIMTPTYLLVSEVKHISGNLIFDHDHYQLIRTLDGIEEIFQDPIQQVELQKFQLSQWLSDHFHSQAPIHTLVVVTNPNSKISTTSPQGKVPKCVIRSTALIERIKKLDSIYKKETWTKKDMNKLCRLLIKHHTEKVTDVLEKYNINQSELLTGVYCPECLSYSVRKTYGSWACAKCSFTSKNAHVTALIEYALLISPTITNRQLRSFLHLESTNIANRMISSLNLKSTGSTKGTTYDLTSLVDNLLNQ